MNKIITFFREASTARFFIPTGLFLIIFGVLVFVINFNNQNYLEIQSVVSNVELSQEEYTDGDGNTVEATYNVKVKYTVNGKEYETELTDISKCKVGDKMKIYYNPNNPNEITQSKSLVFPLIIIGLGIASFVFGLISAFKYNKSIKYVSIE